MDQDRISDTIVAPEATRAPADTPVEKPGFFRRNSLKLAGIFNLIGDVGFLGSGIKTRDTSKIVGGALYTLGGANLAMFGKPKPEHAVEELTEKTADMLQNAMGGLPEGSGLAKAEAQKTADTLKGSLYKHAAQNTLGVYTAGAGALLVSGIRKYRANPKEWAGMGYGISSLAVKSLSLLIPEKTGKDAEDKKSSGGLLGWIREKPLRIFGYGSVITDTMLAAEAVQGYRAGHKNAWSVLTAGTYIISDLLMAISNKNPDNATGKLRPEDQHGIEAMAAEAIAAQPEEKRGELVAQAASFLAAQPNTTGTAEDIKKSIREQVEALGKNRWAQRVSAPAESPQPSL